jgi:hypothetical protein
MKLRMYDLKMMIMIMMMMMNGRARLARCT